MPETVLHKEQFAVLIELGVVQQILYGIVKQINAYRSEIIYAKKPMVSFQSGIRQKQKDNMTVHVKADIKLSMISVPLLASIGCAILTSKHNKMRLFI